MKKVGAKMDKKVSPEGIANARGVIESTTTTMSEIPLAPWDELKAPPPIISSIPSVPVSGEHIFRMPDWHVWCGSIVKNPDAGYSLFYSCWPRERAHEGWVTHSEIWMAEAPEPWGPYSGYTRIFAATGGNAWDADNFHNVTVKSFGEKYYMYYSGNHGNGDWWVHRNNQRIGVAVADHPKGPWQRFPTPVLDISPDSWDSLCVTNPSVCEKPDGGYLMIYKGVTNGNPPFGTKVLHGIASADTPTGPFVKEPQPLFDFPGECFPFEDPHIWCDGSGYRCLMKDMVGIPGSVRRSVLIFDSPNGRDWNPKDFKLVATPQIRWPDGRYEQMDRLERPSYFADGNKKCMTFAVKPVGEDLSFIVINPLVS